MTYLFSESSTYYKSPTSVRVGDRVYHNITSHITKDMLDDDGRRKVVNYLDGKTSDFVSYVENNKVVRSEEMFHTPKVMKFGDRVYKGVVSKVTIPEKYDMYNVFTPDGHFNNVKVRANGSVLDINELYSQLKVRKLKSSFKALARLVVGK